MATFSQKIWAKISEDCKDIISKMLQGNPDNRITVDEALEHKWFTKYCKD
jgi:serine/threonine protein kinase